MKTLACSFLLFVAVALPAYAQRYVANLIGTETTQFGLGAATGQFARADVLASLAKAQQPPVDPRTLELIFDLGTKEFLVVNRADGATVAVLLTLTNDQEVNFGAGDIVGDPSGVIRRADLLEPGNPTPVGSISGLVRRGLGESGVIEYYRNYYRWVADFQVLSQTGGTFVVYNSLLYDGAHFPMLLRGQFKVRNLPFVPASAVER